MGNKNYKRRAWDMGKTLLWIKIVLGVAFLGSRSN
jgi:hypothetical protein